jgi:uncharacterized paraquat-inducible protein A
MIKQIKRISRFFYSLFWHCIEGFPTCSKEEILERYNICTSCEHYSKKPKSEDATCNICGCNLTNRKEFMNKLAWADQECPKGFWKAKKSD